MSDTNFLSENQVKWLKALGWIMIGVCGCCSIAAGWDWLPQPWPKILSSIVPMAAFLGKVFEGRLQPSGAKIEKPPKES